MEYRSRRLLTARICRESGLKGVHQKGRQAGVHCHRCQPGAVKRPSRARRTRDTDHRQRSCRAASAGAVKEEHGDILCRKKRAVARPSPSYFIPVMRHLVDYPLRRGDFRQLIIICRGRPFQFPHSTSTSSPRSYRCQPQKLQPCSAYQCSSVQPKRRLNSATTLLSG